MVPVSKEALMGLYQSLWNFQVIMKIYLLRELSIILNVFIPKLFFVNIPFAKNHLRNKSKIINNS